MTTMSAREFNHDVSAAKRAAAGGPVVITDHGRPSHVLLTYEEFEMLSRVPATGLGGWLAMEDGDDIDFEPSRLEFTAQGADLS